MKTAEIYTKSIQQLGEATEAYLEAEAKYEKAKGDIILEDAEYQVLKNEGQRKAYITEKLKEEQELVDATAKEKRHQTVINAMAEVAWKSEKYDIMLKVGKLD